MELVNIHQAKTNLSSLIERVSQGDHFIIAKAGKPMATLIPFAAPTKGKFYGSMKGQFEIPDDFDTMCEDEIHEMFYADKVENGI
jgi:prevent-host-death family protein